MLAGYVANIKKINTYRFCTNKSISYRSRVYRRQRLVGPVVAVKNSRLYASQAAQVLFSIILLDTYFDLMSRHVWP